MAAENHRHRGHVHSACGSRFPWACCVLAHPGNWNCIAVIWILGFGLFREDPAKKWGFYVFCPTHLLALHLLHAVL